MKLHPFLYLSFLLMTLTLVNVIMFKKGIKIPEAREKRPNRYVRIHIRN